MLGKTLLLALQLQIPAPQGYVNDFAGVLSRPAVESMNLLIEEVRQKSRGEIAVVTLNDLEGRASIDVARDIGREWGVGAQQEAGDAASNAGVVLLLVPGQRPGDGRSDLAIATGRGAEGFITDAETFRIRQAIGQTAAETGSFERGLQAGVQLLADEYAAEFGFTIDGRIARPQRPQRDRDGGIGIGWFVLLVLLILFGGGRRGGGFWQFLAISALLGGGGHRHRGGFGGGWGGGGFGGGGFGGFGGGGGFSGGGSSGSF